jgi:hypothetical protein
MALDKTSLHSDIKSILEKDPPSASEKNFADNLMDAYESYAKEAEDISGDKILAPLSVSAASGILEPALISVNEIIETKDEEGKIIKREGITKGAAESLLTTALGAALLTVWTGVNFALTAPGELGTSIFTAKELLAVVSVPGLAPSAAITSLLPTEDTSKAASVWADAMDNFTQTVQVTITGLILVTGGTAPSPPITAPIT